MKNSTLKASLKASCYFSYSGHEPLYKRQSVFTSKSSNFADGERVTKCINFIEFDSLFCQFTYNLMLYTLKSYNIL